MNLVDVERLCEVAEVEFADIVVETIVLGVNELRLVLKDGSFIDLFSRQDRYRTMVCFLDQQSEKGGPWPGECRCGAWSKAPPGAPRLGKPEWTLGEISRDRPSAAYRSIPYLCPTTDTIFPARPSSPDPGPTQDPAPALQP